MLYSERNYYDDHIRKERESCLPPFSLSPLSLSLFASIWVQLSLSLYPVTFFLCRTKTTFKLGGLKHYHIYSLNFSTQKWEKFLILSFYKKRHFDFFYNPLKLKQAKGGKWYTFPLRWNNSCCAVSFPPLRRNGTNFAAACRVIPACHLAPCLQLQPPFQPAITPPILVW